MSLARWIWNYGDFELFLFNKCMRRRYQRDVLITPFWRIDNYYTNVKFCRKFTLTKTNHIKIVACGEFNIFIDQIGYIANFDGILTLEKGSYDMSILVNNIEGLPCIFVEGEELNSDDNFFVSAQDFKSKPAGCYAFNDINISPNDYKLQISKRDYISCKEVNDGKIYDFGDEICGYLRFDELGESSVIDCYYGESEVEALDKQFCEQYDKIVTKAKTYLTQNTKAFRYLYIEANSDYKVIAVEELSELKDKSKFQSSDKLLNEIWNKSIRTLSLCGREFFIDGIKRDRWSWSGDAYQSYLINYYCFFDREIIQRTTIALKGKEPMRTHINHIMDYTMYWIMGIYDYYLYTGDMNFLKQNYDGVLESINFCLSRLNSDGLLENLPNDWVYIDWAEMDNIGETSFEQVLFVVALKQMAKISNILGLEFEKYEKKADEIWNKTIEIFWSEEKGCFVHSRKDGKLSNKITKYSNIFAVLYELCNETQKETIVKNVLLNCDVQKIITPYMRFYELSTLAMIGEEKLVLDEIKKYWGGMIEAGANTFWEKYNEDEKDDKKYAMYDRAYGKSLCHAWGATPIYIISRWLLGLKPTTVGYETFELKPCVNILKNLDITLPTNQGDINIKINDKDIEIFSSNIDGTVILKDKVYCVSSGKKYNFSIEV